MAVAGIGAGLLYDLPEPELLPFDKEWSSYEGKKTNGECAAMSFKREATMYRTMSSWMGTDTYEVPVVIVQHCESGKAPNP